MSLRRKRLESSMQDEIRFHIDAYADDLVKSGIARSEAQRRARIEFGGAERVRDECRQALGLRWLDDLLADLRYAGRMLRRNPAFAAVAVDARGIMPAIRNHVRLAVPGGFITNIATIRQQVDES